ncbi:SAM-dependent methyltransferase [Actinomadura sp. 7K507]|uniref:SAM-dependent methyltransferase n=1 Tax=Actinomadura sp. 7K507 TaxID=2530365 RepID=UPI001043EC61|nr:SAM-dependent methyltransferase [Actinomadura sp. 7K507]TDC76908.1 SAM-dependent methyltransferase [Actinomadura sp. 7K507]
MTADGTPSGLDDVIRGDVPHSARIYNYWLGGKDNFEIDRAIGESVVQAEPEMLTMTRHNRAFLGRAVEYLVTECGIRQFLDVGTGLPTADNTHEVAQRAAPESRIVYVDNDPIVLAHARALLTSTPEGATDYLDADLREPRKVLAAAAATLDFSKPVGVILLGVLGHIAEDGDARAVIDALMDGTCAGSHLTISVNTNVVNKENMDRAAASYNEAFGRPPIYMYTPERLAAHFAGMELVDPGVVSVARWRPAGSPSGGEPPEMDAFAGVARKP